jgi:hypothetical protein
VALFPVPIGAVTACISNTKNEKSYAMHIYFAQGKPSYSHSPNQFPIS